MFSISLNPLLQGYFTEDPRGFEDLMNVEGEVFRAVKNRRTVRFERGGKRFFIKAHRGVSLKECFKNLATLKLPVSGAAPEWRGIEALESVGVGTMRLAGKGARGWFPLWGASFVVTEALEDAVSLEDLLQAQETIGSEQRNRLKRVLIPQLGETARRMHEGGVNHRDFYLCHFLTGARDWSAWKPSDPIALRVIDLHRAQRRAKPTPARWRIKDLGALMYSAFEADITVTDAVRFIRAYYGPEEPDWKRRYREDRLFWFRVAARALGFQKEWDRQQMKQALREM